MSNPLHTAVIIDDVPDFPCTLSQDWVCVHVDDASGFARALWFNNPRLDWQGYASCDACLYEDGGEVPDHVFQATSDAWNKALFHHLTGD